MDYLWITVRFIETTSTAMSCDSTGRVIPVHLTIAGRMDDARYQQAKVLADSLSKLNKFTTFELVPLVEVDWVEYLRVKKTVGSRMHTPDVLSAFLFD